ncbi:Endoribonuclease Dicer-like protein [Vigna angularis]|uniref:Endoribonuclease Dicer-like protein n=2 Tax=Phaseolus angularis TaxID=3914 RepID=A0A8T0L1T5_PHAAN|nr:Endoribonuclease Dicer-like protein [Vigna angularis]BAT85048.1 hypothetical protein VIGAN_04254000 [Vigna angularis var. angularis]
MRPSDRFHYFFQEEQRIFSENKPFSVSKLCKLLMMSKNKLISADNLLDVKRKFGFPNLFLVDWNSEFVKSIIEKRAEEESERLKIKVIPNFKVELLLRDKKVVWQSIKLLLEPFITLETLKLHPIREFYEVCQKRNYRIIQDVVSGKGDQTNYRVNVEADEVSPQYEYIGASLKDTTKKIVCKELWNSLKEGYHLGK